MEAYSLALQRSALFSQSTSSKALVRCLVTSCTPDAMLWCDGVRYVIPFKGITLVHVQHINETLLVLQPDSP